MRRSWHSLRQGPPWISAWAGPICIQHSATKQTLDDSDGHDRSPQTHAAALPRLIAVVGGGVKGRGGISSKMRATQTAAATCFMRGIAMLGPKWLLIRIEECDTHLT